MSSRKLLGQGATEYLVLLAVILVVALVGIALLGDVFGRTSDVKLSQSQSYWSSASPLAIVASSIYRNPSSTSHYPYLRVKNTGADPIRLRAIVAGNNVLNTYRSANGITQSISSIYIPAGREICFGSYGSNCQYSIAFVPGSSGSAELPPNQMFATDTVCSTDGEGVVSVQDFGFDYDIIKGNSVLSRRFVGQTPLVIPCGVCTGGSSCYW
ncbi:MAG: hypothetical protein N3F07_00215 [Candidatus Micrarchaeota archaeon]|nr:hypothetical protein [Candidatus Micrarchaeota archaeon]